MYSRLESNQQPTPYKSAALTIAPREYIFKHFPNILLVLQIQSPRSAHHLFLFQLIIFDQFTNCQSVPFLLQVFIYVIWILEDCHFYFPRIKIFSLVGSFTRFSLVSSQNWWEFHLAEIRLYAQTNFFFRLPDWETNALSQVLFTVGQTIQR